MVYKKPTLDIKTQKRLKMKDWRKVQHTNTNQKQDIVAIMVSNKEDLRGKNITRDKEGPFIIIKGTIIKGA